MSSSQNPDHPTTQDTSSNERDPADKIYIFGPLVLDLSAITFIKIQHEYVEIGTLGTMITVYSSEFSITQYDERAVIFKKQRDKFLDAYISYMALRSK